MNKRFKVWLPLLFALVMIFGITVGYKLQSNMGEAHSGDINGITEEVLALVEAKYVDKENMDSLNRAAIDVILNNRDPHAIQMSALRLIDLNKESVSSLLYYNICISRLSATFDALIKNEQTRSE